MTLMTLKSRDMIIALKIYFTEPSDKKTSTTMLLGAETGLFLMFSQNAAEFLQRTSPLSLEQKSRKTCLMRVQLIQEASRFHVDQGGSGAWGISWL